MELLKMPIDAVNGLRNMSNTFGVCAIAMRIEKDGLYLLNLQVAPFENDAAPSRPLIFPLKAV